MKRDWTITPQLLQHGQAWTAVDHVIFGMNLEPKSHRRRGQCFAEMLRLKAKAGGGSHGD